ncbi:MAG: DNA repair protein RadA [candidate division WOR-3 bacterium]|nr:DNA repair protein RadA [candidate division WOR-3 bacterium]MCX7756840.1 DNA repair protein RadA [candidate division WOR-3 bacterium]MDW7987511.1 DNA repair protein RadA [candidate division WOR-3 bacterium]
MKKDKYIYVCSVCGEQSLKWLGHCPVCGAWNSFCEELKIKDTETRKSIISEASKKPELLSQINPTEILRYKTNLGDLDDVTGGGLVPASVILLGGEPGIGKSTLALQILNNIFNPENRPLLYVSGEESSSALALRAQRLGITNKNIYLYTETNLEKIIFHIEELKPLLVIVDSIQTLYSDNLLTAPGSISQVRTVAQELVSIVKTHKLIAIIIGHITKFGALAGPKTLEHIVDLVLYFEGERYGPYRLLRVFKNRYGPTSDLAVFEMTDKGLIPKPSSSIFLSSGAETEKIGRALVPVLEGERPFLIELEALSATSYYNYPQRITSGLDLKRLAMLLSVLEHHLDIHVGSRDIFVKTSYGITVDDPAADLAILMAIISSYYKKPLPRDTAVLGEVALSGEIRGVLKLPMRLKECEKLSLKEALVPAVNIRDQNLLRNVGIKIIGVENLKSAIEILKLSD